MSKTTDQFMSDSDFVKYCMSFYGPQGIYPMDFNTTQIRLAMGILKSRLASNSGTFCADSVDREWIRDIIVEARQAIEARQDSVA
jgi:hypothetical protein